MTTETVPMRADDPAIAYRDGIEAHGIKAALGVTAYAIVTIIKGEVVGLVTPCRANERATWRELLGLHMTHGAVEDIDANWGMAWINPDGSMQMAGPNLEFAQQALDNLGTYRFTDGDTRLTVENNNKYDTPFAFFGDGDEGPVYVDVEVLPEERRHIAELTGVSAHGPWGLAWQPISVKSTEGGDQLVHHRVIAACGTTPEMAYQAFADLAILS